MSRVCQSKTYTQPKYYSRSEAIVDTINALPEGVDVIGYEAEQEYENHYGNCGKWLVTVFYWKQV